ncbi:MAG TPA: ABC-2 family transporter protein [Anaerolineae bacterium]|jgi:ABC-2 type transport system permease protein
MRFTLDIYRRLILVQIRSQLQYRASFLLDSAAMAFNNGISFLTLALILQRFDGVGGWSLAEVAFLYGMVEVAFGVMDMLFSGFDPDNFGRHVRLGRFDQLLLRPLSVSLQVFGSQFIIRRLGRIAQGLAVLLFAIANLNIQWTLVKLLYMPVVITSLVGFFGGLFMVGATITFWTIESIEVINIFTYGGSEMMAYPMHIYPDWMRRFFTFVLPAIFLNYAPALYFLGKSDPLGLPSAAAFMAPLAGLATLFAAALFWQFGMRHYKSTGT